MPFLRTFMMSLVIFGSTAFADIQKVTLDANGKELPGISPTSLSGDGHFVFFAKNGRLYRRDLTTHDVTDLAPACTDDNVCFPIMLDVSIDGKVVEFTVMRPGEKIPKVEILNLDTGVAQYFPSDLYRSPRLSPTGETVAWFDQDRKHVILHDLSTGVQQKLEDPQQWDGGLRFSPDGKWLTWEGNESGYGAGIRIYEMKTGQLRTFFIETQEIYNSFNCYVISNGAEAVCYTEASPRNPSEERYALIRVDLKTLKFKYLNVDENGEILDTDNFVITADGSTIYFDVIVSDTSDDIYRIDLNAKSGGLTKIVHAENHQKDGLGAVGRLSASNVDGEKLLIESNANNLIPNDSAPHADGYLWTNKP